MQRLCPAIDDSNRLFDFEASYYDVNVHRGDVTYEAVARDLGHRFVDPHNALAA